MSRSDHGFWVTDWIIFRSTGGVASTSLVMQAPKASVLSWEKINFIQICGPLLCWSVAGVGAGAKHRGLGVAGGKAGPAQGAQMGERSKKTRPELSLWRLADLWCTRTRVVLCFYPNRKVTECSYSRGNPTEAAAAAWFITVFFLTYMSLETLF